MKTNCCELLLSFLLAFAIITNALLGGAAASDAVLDIANEQMQVTNYYYIESPPNHHPTMVTGLLGGVNDEICPLDVALKPLSIGFPVRFSPANSSHGVVPLYTDLNIIFYFSPKPQCAVHTSVWKGQYHEESEEYSVRIDGVKGNPGCETIANWFKIEKLENYYKLVFCPTVCKNPYCKAICKDVGLDSQNRFVLSDTPALIGFRQAGVQKSTISDQY